MWDFCLFRASSGATNHGKWSLHKLEARERGEAALEKNKT